MKQKIAVTLLSAALALSAALPLSGCTTANATDLMSGITPTAVSLDPDLVKDSAAVTDFAVKLFQNSLNEEGNTLISPLSVLSALAMTANGAKGETLSQMEDVLGLPREQLNAYLHTYMTQLPQGDKSSLNLANSIWFRDDEGLTVEQEFLQTNADFYGADLYKAPFNSATCKEINAWVKKNTDGLIDGILDQIPENAMLYLINALAFDAEWANIYTDGSVKTRTFTKENGRTQDVELMYAGEHLYLEDEHATGFIKYYDGYGYAFAALLPNEGISVADYVSTLTGEHLNLLLSNPVSVEVDTAIPKFETAYTVDMSAVLQDMGMTHAFDMFAADFSAMGSHPEGNLFINRVLHKAFITVDERGTKAGAVTTVEAACGAAMPEEEPKRVILDRPFVYLLIDCETNLPFFLGTVMDVH